MKLLIDIPEDEYELVRHENKSYRTELVLMNAVAEGTPLPKHHSRLIDYGYVVDAIDDWVNAEEYRYTNATDYLRKRVANTPTIIEADKED